MDIRENAPVDWEEILRATVLGLQKNVHTIMPAQVTQDTEDGHVATVQPTIKRAVTNADGSVSYEDHPIHPDVPIHHLGGGGVSHTFPNKQGDTGAVLYAARSIDSWFQSDGSQQPMDDRMHSQSDAFFLSGVRSIPRALKQVEKDAAQHRSDDKKHVAELHPQNGHHVKSVDPSTAAANDDFDPFKQATKFFEHITHPTNGIVGNATDNGTTHNHGVTHEGGAFMTALNAAHSVLAHPSNGASMNAANFSHTVLAHPTNGASMNAASGKHSVLAHPDLGSLLSAAFGAHTVKATPGGVQISSSSSIALSAPSLSLPSGSVGGSAMAAGGVGAAALAGGASAANVGALGGDLSGNLPEPQVVGITKVSGFHTWPSYANDAAAATAGIAIDQPYRNGSQLMVRVS